MQTSVAWNRANVGEITLEKYEGELPASVGAERGTAAKQENAVPAVPTFAI